MDKKNIFTGAFALVFAGIAGKVISASYRIPLQNLTGDIGFYIYQQIYPLIGIAITFALYGLPSAAAAFIIDKRLKSGNKRMMQRIFHLLFLLGVFLFFILFLCSPMLADLMGDRQLISPIRHVAWLFLFMPFVAYYRGRLQAMNDLQSIANSQMVEQLTRAFIIIITAIWIYQGKITIYRIADGAVIGTVIAFTASFLLLYFIWKKKYANREEIHLINIPYSELFKHVLLTGIVISMNHMMLLFMQLADAFTILPGLVESGMTQKEAMKWKGIFDRGQPLLQLVTIVGSSFAMALVPQVTKIAWQQDKEGSIRHLMTAMKYCLLISLGATVGLILLMPEINELFYKNMDGSNSLRILSIVLLFTALSLTMASVLQGLGYMKWIAIVLFTALLLKMMLNSLLVPTFSINGAAIATILSIGFIAISYLYILQKHVIKEQIRIIPVGRVFIAAISMIAGLLLLKYIEVNYFIIDTRVERLISVLVSVFTGFALYFFSLVRLRVFTQKELETLPFMNKWIKKER
ncbi:putative polysaccharide biosynthesis protein [Gracilibacillus xinjiangensis]|uniref:Oligosaccharide flippase family protein n=1 Tax=Gracilibacillus xinjiangensis TaxID=1193282 RepID=A0ABV8WUR0_9BACI